MAFCYKSSGLFKTKLLLRPEKLKSKASVLLSKVMASGENLTVTDDPNQSRFIMKFDSGEGTIDYKIKGNVYDLIDTNITPEYQGKGLGKILAQVRNFCFDACPAIVDLNIVENESTKRISMKLNGEVAEIRYNKDGDVYILTDSFIPEKYRNRGLGKILAQKTFDHLIQNGKKMKLTCEFLQHFYENNKKNYSNHVV